MTREEMIATLALMGWVPYGDLGMTSLANLYTCRGVGYWVNWNGYRGTIKPQPVQYFERLAHNNWAKVPTITLREALRYDSL